MPGLIVALLLAFSGYCWQSLSQQQQAHDLNEAAEVVLNRINADTVYLLGREQANDSNVQQRLNQLSITLDGFVRKVRSDPELAQDELSQALLEDMDTYLMALASLHAMEMAIEYINAPLQAQIKKVREISPSDSALHRDVEELAQLSNDLQRSWTNVSRLR